MKGLLLVLGCTLGWQATMYAQDTSAVTDISQLEFVLPDETEPVQPLVPPDQLDATRAYKEQKIVVRRFDDQKWKEIVRGVDYNETPRKVEKQEAESDSSPGNSMPWGGALLRLVSYGVVIAVILALVYLVVKNMSFDMRIRRTRIATSDPEQAVDDIETLDLESSLERARKEGNFKLVVRLYYLDLLKKLNEYGVIRWKKDKTNRDYLSEIYSSNFFFDDIRRLTLSYEAIWYGDHDLRQEAFRDLTDRFESVYEKIKIELKA